MDDLSAAALGSPGVNATLVGSETYLTDDLPVDPARIFALVDQGENGVFLQWTTPLNGQTLGAHANADVAAVLGGKPGSARRQRWAGERRIGVARTLLHAHGQCDRAKRGHGAGLRPVGLLGLGAGQWRKDRPWRRWFRHQCHFGLRCNVMVVHGGLDYAVDGNWNLGVFGAYAKTSADDLGSVVGIDGKRSSDADVNAGYGGAYVLADYDVFYFAGVGIAGQASTDLTNGVLFNATSDYDSFIWGLSGTMGAKVAMGGGGWYLDRACS